MGIGGCLRTTRSKKGSVCFFFSCNIYFFVNSSKNNFSYYFLLLFNREILRTSIFYVTIFDTNLIQSNVSDGEKKLMDHYESDYCLLLTIDYFNKLW